MVEIPKLPYILAIKKIQNHFWIWSKQWKNRQNVIFWIKIRKDQDLYLFQEDWRNNGWGTLAKAPMETPYYHSNYQTLTMVKKNGKEFFPSLSIYRYFGWFQKFTIIYLFWSPNYFIESGFLLFILYSFGKLAFNVFLSFSGQHWVMAMM